MEYDADAILDDSILYCFAECKPDQKVSPIFFKFYEDEVNCAIDRKWNICILHSFMIKQLK